MVVILTLAETLYGRAACESPAKLFSGLVILPKVNTGHTLVGKSDFLHGFTAESLQIAFPQSASAG